MQHVIVGIVPIAYLLPLKQMLFFKYRVIVACVLFALAVVSVAGVHYAPDKRYFHLGFAPLLQFGLIVAVEELFRALVGRYPAPDFSEPSIPAGERADQFAMTLALIGSILVVLLVVICL